MTALEDEPRENPDLYRILYDAIPSPIYHKDADGTFLGCNKAFEEYTGFDRREIVGKSIFDLLSTKMASFYHKIDRELIENGCNQTCESHIARSDGSFHNVVISKAAYHGEDGRVAGLVGIMTDITPHRIQEEELRQAKEAAEAGSRAKSEFLATMSHELRTPLNAIIGFSDLLLSKKAGVISDVQEDYLNFIRQSANHLLSLINDILDLSKVEAGKSELFLSEVPLKNLILGSLMMIQEKTMTDGVALRVDLDAVPDVTIMADARKLKQIIYNLLSNAAKFTPGGGEIHVAAKLASCKDIPKEAEPDEGTSSASGAVDDPMPEVCTTRRQRWVMVSVADTGIGVEPHDLERIFRPFEQGSRALTRKFQGTGLGLSLSRKLVELHGGRIWVESEGAGKGSKFCFTVPLVCGKAQSSPFMEDASLSDSQLSRASSSS